MTRRDHRDRPEGPRRGRTAPSCDEGLLPLLHAQRGLLNAQLADPANAAVNVVMTLDITGDLDIETYNEAIGRTLEEFDTFRLRLCLRDGDWFQHCPPSRARPAEVLDVRAEADPVAAAERHFARLDEQAFDLVGGGELFRVQIVRVADRHAIVYFAAHHLACDGYAATWSQLRVAEVYRALVNGTEVPPAAVRPLADLLVSTRPDPVDVEFWSDYLRGVGPRLSLSSNRSRPAARPHVASRCVPGGFAALRAIGDRPRWFTAGLALVTLQLAHLLEATEVVVGFTTPGRTTLVERSTPAQLMNVVPLRVPVPPGVGLDATQHAIETELSRVRPHLTARPEDLVWHLPVGWRQARVYGPTFNALPPLVRLDLPGCDVVETIRSRGPVDDLMWTFHPRGPDLLVELRGNPHRYDATTVTGIHDELCRTVTALVEGGR